MKQVRIGGQAVLEGIMMKGPASYSLAVRKADGEIAVEVTPYRSFCERKGLLRVPIVRGVINFVESLYIGIKTLMHSSEYVEDEEEEEEEDGSEKKGEKPENKPEKKLRSEKTEEEKAKEEKENRGYMIVTLKATDRQWVANLAEGVLRLVIFLAYVAIIAHVQEIKRTFMYHGAEHKTINCLEAGDDLTPENVLKHTRFHKRCGTSFVFIVMIISIIVFMFVHTDVMWLRLLSRILLIPVIAGLSYEVLQYAGRHENACSRIMSAPGLWVQRLTTKEPDLAMAEVAIRAVEEVIDVQEYLDCVRNHSFE